MNSNCKIIKNLLSEKIKIGETLSLIESVKKINDKNIISNLENYFNLDKNKTKLFDCNKNEYLYLYSELIFNTYEFNLEIFCKDLKTNEIINNKIEFFPQKKFLNDTLLEYLVKENLFF